MWVSLHLSQYLGVLFSITQWNLKVLMAQSMAGILWRIGLPLRPEKALPSPAPFSPMFKLNKWEPKRVFLEPMSCQVVCPSEHRQL